MTQNRFKSPVVRGAIIAQVLSLGQLTGLFAKYGVDAGVVGDILASVLQLAVIVGILNNPVDKTDW